MSNPLVPAGLDDADALELLRRQDALQAEARRVVAELDLVPLLSRAGRVEQVGSSVSGLMVWRDLDVTVLCRDLTAERAFETVRPLLTHPRVTAFDYRNQTGRRAPPVIRGDERYYVAAHWETAAGAAWKIDVSLLLTDAPRDYLPYAERLARQLTAETRLAILWIKDVWRQLPTYPDEGGAFDVYEAVLRGGVRTPEQFDAYLRERGLPGRSGGEL
jgi:GrpB-like predicted nucleotidyltransferase (UPF0157 family)